MKRSVISVALAIALLGLGIASYIGAGSLPAAQAKHDSKNCSLSNLKGSYGYTLTGFYSPSPGFNVPLGVVGTATLSEDGRVANNDTLVVNGVVTENRIYAGTVTLNPGNPCTGKIAYDNGLKDNFVVVDDGEELQFIQTAPEAPATALQAVVTGAAKRQSSQERD
jgi:hypothetical protein